LIFNIEMLPSANSTFVSRIELVPQSRGFTLLQSMQADVLIVGGGVIGVATAYALCKSRSDLKVVLLEAGEFGAVNGRCGLQLILVQPTDPCFHSWADDV
jgi:ribulose 1,5-bisphosphate synthetase/thiazole synthase